MNRNDEKEKDLKPIPPVPPPNAQRPEREGDDLEPALKAELEARRLEDDQSEAAQDELSIAISGQDASKVPEKPAILRPRRTRT